MAWEYSRPASPALDDTAA
jgi:hypothetical protein